METLPGQPVEGGERLERHGDEQAGRADEALDRAVDAQRIEDLQPARRGPHPGAPEGQPSHEGGQDRGDGERRRAEYQLE